jgi:hypothetical protein
MGHQVQDQVSLELARRVAAGLPKHPEWLKIARANLERWSRKNHDAPGLLRCYREWEQLLTRPSTDIAAILTAAGDDGQRLRQNSPFVGVLSPQEVWEIKSRIRHYATIAA